MEVRLRARPVPWVGSADTTLRNLSSQRVLAKERGANVGTFRMALLQEICEGPSG